MKPIGIDNISENSEEMINSNFANSIGNTEILNLVNKNISIKNRTIFLKMMGGSKVSKTELTKLVTEIKKILSNNDIQS